MGMIQIGLFSPPLQPRAVPSRCRPSRARLRRRRGTGRPPGRQRFSRRLRRRRGRYGGAAGHGRGHRRSAERHSTVEDSASRSTATAFAARACTTGGRSSEHARRGGTPRRLDVGSHRPARHLRRPRRVSPGGRPEFLAGGVGRQHRREVHRLPRLRTHARAAQRPRRGRDDLRRPPQDDPGDLRRLSARLRPWPLA